jgi:hypothetical protein
MWKETVVAYFELIFQNFLVGLRKNTKISVKLIGLGDDIRDQDIPKTKQEF